MSAPSVQKLKRYAKCLLGRDFLTHYDRQLPTICLGSAYGGWTLFPDPIGSGSVIYSFGIGKDISFDLALIQRFGTQVYGFDPTQESNDWVKEQNFTKDFVMHHYGLADHDGIVTFFPPKDDREDYTIVNRHSEEVQDVVKFDVKRLETVMTSLGHRHIDVLKMDIEGAEYAVVEDLCQGTIRPSQLLLEYHHMYQSISIAQTKASIALLRENGYELYHISDSGYEYSFIHADAL